MVSGVRRPVILSIPNPAPNHRPIRLLVQRPHVLLILCILCIDVHKKISIPRRRPGRPLTPSEEEIPPGARASRPQPYSLPMLSPLPLSLRPRAHAVAAFAARRVGSSFSIGLRPRLPADAASPLHSNPALPEAFIPFVYPCPSVVRLYFLTRLSTFSPFKRSR